MRNLAIVAGALLLPSLLVVGAFGVTRTADNALLPEGKAVPTRTPAEPPVPLFPPCGEIWIGSGTCTVYDGFIDSEWANAAVYDVSDTCGQSDGLPNEPGSVYLYLMQDDVQLYIGVDAVIDLYEDYYDQCGFYFDDSDNGCWPETDTNEGNIWLVDDLAGGFCLWRWWTGECDPDPDCGGYCEYTNLGGFYYVYPCGYGVGTASGHMQYEMGVYFGAMADEEWEIQTDFNAGEHCGFYMYCLDQYYYDFIGEIPCTGYPETYRWPCWWPSLFCVKPEFTFKMDVFQTQVPIGGTLDFAKHFHNNTCNTMTIYDTIYAYKGGNLKKKFKYTWTVECEQDLDVCFALKVPPKDQFICWDVTLVNSGVGVAGGIEYPFSDQFDLHIEPGHKSEVACP